MADMEQTYNSPECIQSMQESGMNDLLQIYTDQLHPETAYATRELIPVLLPFLSVPVTQTQQQALDAMIIFCDKIKDFPEEMVRNEEMMQSALHKCVLCATHIPKVVEILHKLIDSSEQVATEIGRLETYVDLITEAYPTVPREMRAKFCKVLHNFVRNEFIARPTGLTIILALIAQYTLLQDEENKEILKIIATYCNYSEDLCRNILSLEFYTQEIQAAFLQNRPSNKLQEHRLAIFNNISKHSQNLRLALIESHVVQRTYDILLHLSYGGQIEAVELMIRMCYFGLLEQHEATKCYVRLFTFLDTGTVTALSIKIKVIDSLTRYMTDEIAFLLLNMKIMDVTTGNYGYVLLCPELTTSITRLYEKFGQCVGYNLVVQHFKYAEMSDLDIKSGTDLFNFFLKMLHNCDDVISLFQVILISKNIDLIDCALFRIWELVYQPNFHVLIFLSTGTLGKLYIQKEHIKLRPYNQEYTLRNLLIHNILSCYPEELYEDPTLSESNQPDLALKQEMVEYWRSMRTIPDPYAFLLQIFDLETCESYEDLVRAFQHYRMYD